MARSAVFTWPEPDSAAIAALQTKAAAGNLILNGTIRGASNIYDNPVITLPGISREITLTSGSNLSGVNFTITGTYLGRTIIETITGPNVNTVSSTNLFHTISSVSASAGTGAFTVSVGTGANGITNPCRMDEHSSVCAISAQVVVTSGTGDISYTFYSSLQEIDADFYVTNGFKTIYNMDGSTAQTNIGSHGMLAIEATGSTPPDYNIPVYGQIPVKYCWFTIDGTLADPASLTAIILQQGIT